jgi:hypothetical protein
MWHPSPQKWIEEGIHGAKSIPTPGADRIWSDYPGLMPRQHRLDLKEQLQLELALGPLPLLLIFLFELAK